MPALLFCRHPPPRSYWSAYSNERGVRRNNNTCNWPQARTPTELRPAAFAVSRAVGLFWDYFGIIVFNLNYRN